MSHKIRTEYGVTNDVAFHSTHPGDGSPVVTRWMGPGSRLELMVHDVPIPIEHPLASGIHESVDEARAATLRFLDTLDRELVPA